MESKHNMRSHIFQTTGRVMMSKEDRETIHCKPKGLTITVEKLDHILANVQSQIESLCRERTDLRLVRGELAAMESRWEEA